MASSSSKSEQTTIDHSSLYEAIKVGDIDSLKQLLVKTASKPDEVDTDNHLLRQTHFNNNSLHVAVQLSKSTTLVEEILKQCGSSKSLAMLMQQNMNGDTPLHIAARMQESTEIVSLFIDHARNSQIIIKEGVKPMTILIVHVEQLVMIANKKNNTALHEALSHQPGSGIPQLLIRADPGFEYLANDSDETPLYLAVKFGTLGLVEHILKLHPSQSYAAPGGRTVLHAVATRSAYFQGICPSNTKTFLMFQLSKFYSNVVRLLSHLMEKVDNNGSTALHYAVNSFNLKFIDAVMEVNPSICYMTDKDGMTALHHAAARDYWESVPLIKIMIRHCLDCWDVLDNEGRNFLHVAAHNKNSDVLKYVLNDISSDLVVETIINTIDKHGKTPCQITGKFRNILLSNARVKTTSVMYANRQFDYAFNAQSEEGRKAAADRKAEAQEEEKEISKQMNGYTETLMVVSVLIATVAFAANFTLPGGYNSDGPHKGMAVLANKPAFIWFVVSNSSAMVLSTLAILIQFVGKLVSILFMTYYPEEWGEIAVNLLAMTLICSLLAILAMMSAFVTGTYAVLSHLPGLAIPVCIIGCMFFFLSFFVIYKIVKWMIRDEK
ncbi:hypothetical protein MKW94_016298 [Papaver nudicaule]|uniref:PGG domain-containing protein n=1 Tax=Papaver nudicaule TaxID=74823 RepID=A0AA41VRD7_PAPNU|nr:hypothetical protein [Papaver nudicaule]